MQLLTIPRSEVWPALDYEPHAGQEPIHMSDARHRVAACGRRFGKSTIGGHELTTAALETFTRRITLEDQGQRDEYWIVGPEYSDAEKEFRILWNDISKLGMPLDKPGSYNNADGGDMTVSLWGRRFLCHAKSAKYPDSLVGEGLAGVIMTEAAKLKARIWSKYIRPALADRHGWSLWLSTPEGKNHFYEKWQWGQDQQRHGWESWRGPSWVNSVIFPTGATANGIVTLLDCLESNKPLPQEVYDEVDSEVIEMALEMTRPLFLQEVGADFSEFVGRVFQGFDEETHVRNLQYNPDLPLFAACDYGWTNPFVWLLIQIDVFDNVYVLAEYRTTERDIEDIANDLQQWNNGLSTKAKLFYPDPASPGDSALLSKRLRVPFNKDTGGKLRDRLSYIGQALRKRPEHLPDEHPDKQPKLFIDRSCSGLIWEMGDGYRYPDTRDVARKNPEEPLDKDNHGPEALGRFYRGHFGPPQIEGKAHGRISTAKIRTAA
jgi:hypothetical protein